MYSSRQFKKEQTTSITIVYTRLVLDGWFCKETRQISVWQKLRAWFNIEAYTTTHRETGEGYKPNSPNLDIYFYPEGEHDLPMRLYIYDLGTCHR